MTRPDCAAPSAAGTPHDGRCRAPGPPRRRNRNRDTRAGLLDAAEVCLRSDGYADLRRAGSRTWPACRSARSTITSARRRRSCWPCSSSRTGGCWSGSGDVCRHAAVAAMGEGLRLPRRGSRLGLRARASGDDGARLVEPGDRRRRAQLLGGWYVLLAEIARKRPAVRRPRASADDVAASSAMRFLGAKPCAARLRGARACRSGARCAGSGP